MNARALLTIALAALGCLLVAPAALASQLDDFDVTFTDEEGRIVTQAGSHPYAMTTSFSVPTKNDPIYGTIPEEALKNVAIAQIPGFVGDQTAVQPCPTEKFLELTEASPQVPECADSAVVGVTTVTAGDGETIFPFQAPVYNLTPSPGFVAKLGFRIQRVPVTVDVRVRNSPPYNLVAQSTNISQVLEFYEIDLTLWGVPADPGHDAERGICIEDGGLCPAGLDPVPFLTLPRACLGPLPTRWEIDTWQKPGLISAGSVLTHDGSTPPNPQGMDRCGELSFAPKAAVHPTTSSGESSSGLDVAVKVEDKGLVNPAGTAASDIEGMRLDLPVGLTLNPSAAEGLGVCTLADYHSASLSAPGCPPASKLGTFSTETPLLKNQTLHGSIYLAEQDKNPFGSMFAIYFVLRDPGLGIFVKLAAEVQPNPTTGQLVSVVRQMPQFPLSDVRVRLRSGPRAPLITPRLCGVYSTHALLYPYTGAAPRPDSSTFQISSGAGNSGCAPGGAPSFVPAFEAGSINNAAGSYSPFLMRLVRPDGAQDITRFSAILPPGMVGKIAGVQRCAESQIASARVKDGREELAAPSCPATTRVGRVVAGAGVGSALTYVSGSLYLAGPFQGSPFSVVAVVPAVAGPFDAGTVVTRVGLNLDPNTAQVIVDGSTSEPIPHILAGIPLKIRDIRVIADRPQFTLNPTSCEPDQTVATIFGSGADPFSAADDSAVGRAARFQAASCASLEFRPKLKLWLRGAARRGGNAALRAELKPRPGDANLRGAVVTLPPSQFIDNGHLHNPCTRAQFAAEACPPRTVLGRARAFSPLLDEPLEGNVYFRSNGGERDLPDVVADLRGQVRFTLVIAVLSSRNGRVRTRVLNAPDAPVSRFLLNLAGGRRGLLENSEHLCRRKQRANFNLTGQNGRRLKLRPVLRTSCGKRKSSPTKARGKQSRALAGQRK